MSCVNCGLCPALAPDIYRETDDAMHSFVHRQPQTSEEEAVAEDAASQCPTNSIKTDGHLYAMKKAQAQTV
jgi:ferredoxin